MKNTLFVATYHNNPHFIEYQFRSFQKFVQDEFEFAVLDDSEDTTRSILSGNLAREDIRNECVKWGAKHIAVPQSIHAYYSQGGYVPDENPTTHHPTERHQACIRWLFKNYRQLGFDQYKTMVLLDADVFIKQPINISQYMEYEIIGTGRTQAIDLPLGQFPDKMFPPRVKAINGTVINFLTLYIMLINLEKVNNLETMDIGSWPATDTGSKTNFFIKDNPQYVCSYLNERHDSEYRIDVISKSNNYTADSAEFIHYRAGSNWLYESTDYYREKLNRVLKRYLPDIAPNIPNTQQEFRSRDGEHILRKP